MQAVENEGDGEGYGMACVRGYLSLHWLASILNTDTFRFFISDDVAEDRKYGVMKDVCRRNCGTHFEFAGR